MSVMFHFFGICNKKNFDTSPFQMCVSESVYVRLKMLRIQDPNLYMYKFYRSRIRICICINVTDPGSESVYVRVKILRIQDHWIQVR